MYLAIGFLVSMLFGLISCRWYIPRGPADDAAARGGDPAVDG